MWPSPIGPLGAVPDDGLLNLGKDGDGVPADGGHAGRERASLLMRLSSRTVSTQKAIVIAVGRKGRPTGNGDCWEQCTWHTGPWTILWRILS